MTASRFPGNYHREVQPLSNDLIKAALDGRGFSYFVDADGDGERGDEHLAVVGGREDGAHDEQRVREGADEHPEHDLVRAVADEAVQHARAVLAARELEGDDRHREDDAGDGDEDVALRGRLLHRGEFNETFGPGKDGHVRRHHAAQVHDRDFLVGRDRHLVGRLADTVARLGHDRRRGARRCARGSAASG